MLRIHFRDALCPFDLLGRGSWARMARAQVRGAQGGREKRRGGSREQPGEEAAAAARCLQIREDIMTGFTRTGIQKAKWWRIIAQKKQRGASYFLAP